MAQVISPTTVFMGDRDIAEHEDEVNKAIVTVNGQLMTQLIKRETDGLMVTLECEHGALMEVVYKFRKGGWDVRYGYKHVPTATGYKKVPYVLVGFFKEASNEH